MTSRISDDRWADKSGVLHLAGCLIALNPLLIWLEKTAAEIANPDFGAFDAVEVFPETGVFILTMEIIGNPILFFAVIILFATAVTKERISWALSAWIIASVGSFFLFFGVLLLMISFESLGTAIGVCLHLILLAWCGRSLINIVRFHRAARRLGQ